ncbi:hypothetical protein [Mycoplasma capricolum]|uniref:Uncharacterized protein n=1 Tax=Mycoplasma capricolum subsp. capripneumoniae 87001 TaxID=1124992 RepID=A0A9N7ASH3_MYCCC|nr:hypothetical protein [Mycoplasma capricolum]AJK51318.1 hypothetical protein MCCG_0341 [Mycoplasma capricolum subsp. capripneumoniae 87001]AQU77422.1 hypothetical protein BVA24_01525 [Mycoplasma capricolum subsp. capripneumoniae]UVO25069.1 hypothetical protein zly1402F_01675 [Mycoplasma capricolum subsp. capripneumoniae]
MIEYLFLLKITKELCEFLDDDGENDDFTNRDYKHQYIDSYEPSDEQIKNFIRTIEKINKEK